MHEAGDRALAGELDLLEGAVAIPQALESRWGVDAFAAARQAYEDRRRQELRLQDD